MLFESIIVYTTIAKDFEKKKKMKNKKNKSFRNKILRRNGSRTRLCGRFVPSNIFSGFFWYFC